MSFPKTSRAIVPGFYPQIPVSKLICFEKFAHGRNYIFRTARRFYFDYFHSLIWDRKYYKTVFSGNGEDEGGIVWVVEEIYVTLPFQIYSSYLYDYMANLVRNFKVFPNATKNLFVCPLWDISLIHLKYKS